MSRFRLPLIVGALVALAACDEAAAPKGVPGDVSVRAYVDRDASGSFNAADSALAGVQVTATPTGTTGGEPASATTDATGLATFQDLAPGSYTLSLAGGQPTGAVLTTNPSPTIGVSFQGEITGAPEFRFAFYPGVVTGRIFRDDDNSGGYTTGDVVGAGLVVRLRADTGQAGAVIATVTTDANGVFTFPQLAPGSYFVELENPSTISYGTAGALRRVVVAPQSQLAVPAVFTGSLVVPIAEARRVQAGTTVAVVGRLTAAPGSFTSASGGVNGVNSEIWVQDATGGIAVFSVPTANPAGLALGDSVQVTGTLGSFAGQLQLANNPVVTKRAAGTPLAPRVVTGAQLLAQTFDGQLVRVSGFTVTAVQTGTASSFNVTGTSDDGQTFVVRVTGPTTSGVIVPNTGLTRADFVVGTRYSVTGIATVNVTSTTPPVTTIQIKPRSRADVVVAPLATPARVIINEFMANPAVVADAAGEYIELHNSGGTEQNLQGWIISDNFGVDTIDVPLVIAPGGYVLLGVNANRAQNGNIPVDFQYTANIALGNSGDRIQLRNPANVTVDSVAYATATQAAAGIAMGVVNPALENTDAGGANWVAQTTVYNAGTTPDRGTPRARNDGAVTSTPALTGLRGAATRASRTTSRPADSPASAAPRR